MESSLTDDSSVDGRLVLCSFPPDEEAVDRPGRTRGEVARRPRGRPLLGPAPARTEADERILVFGITMATTEYNLRLIDQLEPKNNQVEATEVAFCVQF